MPPMDSIWSRARGFVMFGWLVALIRFGIDASAHPGRQDPLFWIGVYTLMPIAFSSLASSGRTMT